MTEIEFKHLLVGHKFVLDGTTYTKTNHGRGVEFVKINNRPLEKRFIKVKKSKLVKTDDVYFNNEK